MWLHREDVTMDYPITIHVESAEVLIPCAPREQPEIRLVARLSNDRPLQTADGRDISSHTWEVTIEREVEKVDGSLGFAAISASAGQEAYINAGYRADPAAFDRLDALLARAGQTVQLQLYIDGMVRHAGEETVRWNANRMGSPIHSLNVMADYGR